MPTDMIISTAADTVGLTLDRIEGLLRDKGLTIFARIDHAGAARGAGLDMQEEEVLIFGNPKAGTMLMKERPEIGIELPLRILAWADEDGTTHVGYTDPALVADRYNITEASGIVENMAGLFKAVAS